MLTFCLWLTARHHPLDTVRSTTSRAADSVRHAEVKSLNAVAEEDDAHGAWDHGGIHMLSEADITRNPL